jgi:hypothetical protein
VKAIWFDRFKLLSVLGYVAMGWLIAPAFGELRERLPPDSLAFLVAGGIAYTVGAVFYMLKKVKWFHAVWHLFVLAGSALHFFSALTALRGPESGFSAVQRSETRRKVSSRFSGYRFPRSTRDSGGKSGPKLGADDQDDKDSRPG